MASPRVNKMRRTRLTHAIALSILALCPTAAPAIAEDGCDKFAWPLARERTLLIAASKASVEAGDTLAAPPTEAVTLRLRPSAEAVFALPPERKPKAEKWSGGLIRLPAPDKSGIYQITLSDEAWIDVVQDGRYARSVGNTGRSDCPGVRKSVRFELSVAPFVVQVSGATANAIAVAISPAP